MKFFKYLQSFFSLLSHPNNRKKRLLTIIRIAWWKINQIFFHEPMLVRLIDKIYCICYPESSYGSLIVYSKYPEYYEMLFIQNYLMKDDIFFDVGANIGGVSLLAASKTIAKNLFLFEPNRDAHAILLQNLALNDLNNANVFFKAVSDKDGKISFSSSTISEISHISFENTNADDLIDSVQIDSICKRMHVKQIDFLKIDVEGAELKVLLGAKVMIRNHKISLIMLEMNPQCYKFGYSQQDLIDFLQAHNYTIRTFQDGQLVTVNSVKDLIPNATQNILAFKNIPAIHKRVNFAIGES